MDDPKTWREFWRFVFDGFGFAWAECTLVGKIIAYPVILVALLTLVPFLAAGFAIPWAGRKVMLALFKNV